MKDDQLCVNTCWSQDEVGRGDAGYVECPEVLMLFCFEIHF